MSKWRIEGLRAADTSIRVFDRLSPYSARTVLADFIMLSFTDDKPYPTAARIHIAPETASHGVNINSLLRSITPENLLMKRRPSNRADRPSADG